jgi:pectin-derived oligosaccharide transport system permease protein
MSQQLAVCLIAVTANLVGMLFIYSVMALFLARLHWHGRGGLAVLVTIIVAGLFWMVPTMIGFGYSIVGSSASYSLCFGNDLVSAFALILFFQTVKGIPRQLEDTARLDGYGSFGTWWHVVLPLVRRELMLIALLILMATALPFWANLTAPGGTDFRPFFDFLRLPADGSYMSMLAMSAIMSLPVIALFFIAKRSPTLH